MYFCKDEKVFSLAGTCGVVQRTNLTSLWEEFFSYLVVAGFYVEGTQGNVYEQNSLRLSSEGFLFPCGVYQDKFGRLLSQGLKERYRALLNHGDVNTKERTFLENVEDLFDIASRGYAQITGQQFIQIADARGFSEDMTAVARYAGAMYGQKSFGEDTMVPRLYLSLFGNIHLSKEDSFLLTKPEWTYGSKDASGCVITPLFALLSAQVSAFATFDNPGEVLCEVAGTYSLLRNHTNYFDQLPLPAAATACYVANTLGYGAAYGPANISRLFYQNFLLGGLRVTKLTSRPLLYALIDLMGKTADGETPSELLLPTSCYKQLFQLCGGPGQLRRQSYLESALEALDSDPDLDEEDPEGPTEDSPEPPTAQEPEAVDDTVTNSDEDPEPDPLTDTNGYDPAVPAPAVPAGTPSMEKDSIGLISFDKTGEGIDEDLYRRVVVALNDKIQSDDSVPVTARAKEILNFWVNGYLYRANISATKDRIASLGLEEHLKNILTKG